MTAITQHGEIDRLQEAMLKANPEEFPVTHSFTPGLYFREMRPEKGILIVSRIHKTTHPFVLSKGKVSVWTEGKGVEHLTAPHIGITTPGTRRVILVHEDCVWTTFHPTAETSVQKIEDTILEPMRPVVDIGAYIVEQLQDSESLEELCHR